jgi:hypothetical protein
MHRHLTNLYKSSSEMSEGMMNNLEMTDHPTEQLQTRSQIHRGKTFAIEFAIHELADISMHVIVCTHTH